MSGVRANSAQMINSQLPPYLHQKQNNHPRVHCEWSLMVLIQSTDNLR